MSNGKVVGLAVVFVLGVTAGVAVPRMLAGDVPAAPAANVSFVTTGTGSAKVVGVSGSGASVAISFGSGASGSLVEKPNPKIPNFPEGFLASLFKGASLSVKDDVHFSGALVAKDRAQEAAGVIFAVTAMNGDAAFKGRDDAFCRQEIATELGKKPDELCPALLAALAARDQAACSALLPADACSLYFLGVPKQPIGPRGVIVADTYRSFMPGLGKENCPKLESDPLTDVCAFLHAAYRKR